jgi:hypothetical protein
MIKSKLGFLQMQVEGGWAEAAKLDQPGLGDAPEVLNAVDMRLAVDEHLVLVPEFVQQPTAIGVPIFKKKHNLPV